MFAVAFTPMAKFMHFRTKIKFSATQKNNYLNKELRKTKKTNGGTDDTTFELCEKQVQNV